MFYGRKLRRAAKFAWVLAVNAAILAILLEVSGLAYFALRDGHLYYLGRDEIVTARVAEMGTGLNGADPEELRRRLKEGLSQNKFRLNPYYGYQYEANYRVPVEDFHIRPAEMASNCKFRVNVLCDHGSVYFVTNNFGFDSVLNYPYRKQSDDEFVIGIFGGSIALSVVKSTMPQLFELSLGTAGVCDLANLTAPIAASTPRRKYQSLFALVITFAGLRLPAFRASAQNVRLPYPQG